MAARDLPGLQALLNDSETRKQALMDVREITQAGDTEQIQVRVNNLTFKSYKI